MKVLIVSMAAIAETAGTFTRTKLLAEELSQNQIETATCLAKDVNYHDIPDIQNYELSVPMPLGLPKQIATHTFPIAGKLGITRRKKVNSFDEVLFFTGNTDYRYLKKSVEEIRRAIRDFNPDVVYSEFSISGILAAKLEKKRLFTTVSIPTQFEYSHTNRYTDGVNRILSENGLPKVQSCLELFRLADCSFVPSCPELEAFGEKQVTFCGSWKNIKADTSLNRDTILVYMGNGSISQKKMLKEIIPAFQKSSYQVYIAGQKLSPGDQENIHIAPCFNFAELLPQTALFLHHGGQNSMMDAFLYGVPQIICPGNVFERRFNADSVVQVGAGILLSINEFHTAKIKGVAEEILSQPSYQVNAGRIGNRLRSLGGIANIINKI